MTFDQLAVRADDAARTADERYRDLSGRHEEFIEREDRREVSRRRFATLV